MSTLAQDCTHSFSILNWHVHDTGVKMNVFFVNILEKIYTKTEQISF